MAAGLMARGHGAPPLVRPFFNCRRQDIKRGPNREPVEERHTLFDLARTGIIEGETKGAAHAGRPGESGLHLGGNGGRHRLPLCLCLALLRFKRI